MTRGLIVTAALLVVSGTAVAHDTGTTHQESQSLVPPVVFLAGILVLGTAVVLDSRGALSGRQADLGVGVGALGTLTGIALLFL